MKASLRLVLLPGMDGTGTLFEPFIKLAPSNVNIEIIPLKAGAGQGYLEQAKFIAAKLGNEPCILLAESYSGRIAYELCRMTNTKIVHVIFASSFLSRPSFVSRFGGL